MQKTIVLTFDDACVSQRDNVIPVLKKYGFGATFFVCCRDVWCKGMEEYFLEGKDIADIYREGFEIGNHTLNHVWLPDLSDDECRDEIRKLNEYLASYGIPAPVSFAYPGGPYAANAAKIIPEFGLLCARTTGHELWDLKKTDPMQVPSFSVTQKDEHYFDLAMKTAERIENESSAVVLVYHGVPDIGHPHCNTPPEMFEKHMKYLADNGFLVISMAEFMARGACC
jgi:peptidoglycan/xylan/chitin deacetylase (PgdA/CDA1 family)